MPNNNYRVQFLKNTEDSHPWLRLSMDSSANVVLMNWVKNEDKHMRKIFAETICGIKENTELYYNHVGFI